ncbi:uncharacterized protein LOC110863231 [Folsomia candida]|nr:uncharacterized protein LOC110863231 [Folsomia candida]
MSPNVELEESGGGRRCRRSSGVDGLVAQRPSPDKSSKKDSPTLRVVGGSRRTTMVTPKFRRTPVLTTPGKKTLEPATAAGNDGKETAPTSSNKPESSFADHKEMCSRVAKSLYFANKMPTTPRPSLPLTKLAVSTFSRRARQDTLDFLDLEQAAEIGRNACVTPTALIMALVYLERLSTNNPAYLGSVKPSELFVVSLLVASKFIQDDGEELGIFNDEWATSAHLELKKLNRMELQFLTAIDWRVKVDPDEYTKVLEWLEREVSLGEGKARGWFTYTEVTTLLSFHLLWPTIYQHCVKVITAACMTYATLLATLVTTSILGPHIFILSKSCLNTLTTTGHSYQPCAATNSSSNSFQTLDHYRDYPQATDEQQNMIDEEELTNLNQAEVQLELSLFNFENETYLNKPGIVKSKLHSKEWIRPGLTHFFHLQPHTAQKPFNHGLESLFTQEIRRFFQAQRKHQKTIDGSALHNDCKRKNIAVTSRKTCSISDAKNNDRFSPFGLSLPHAKLIRV